MSDVVKCVKKAGGSLIRHKPLFSRDAKILYVGCGSVLKSFNTDTGEHIQDLVIQEESTDAGPITTVTFHPFDEDILIVCYKRGCLAYWSLKTNSVEKTRNLIGSNDDTKNDKINAIADVKIHVSSSESKTFDIIVAGRSRTNAASGKRIPLLLRIFNEDGKYEEPIRKMFHDWNVTPPSGKNFLAGIKSLFLFVYNFSKRRLNKAITVGKNRYFVCVACHPTEECVAVGDSIGRIILYYDFLSGDKMSPHCVYHWHTNPVNDVVFTDSGSYFYSGGDECVLVKWTPANPEIRHFLPRLPAPIKHITMAPDNQCVAVSMIDNGILIVNPQNQISCTIQEFTGGIHALGEENAVPTGLVYDARSECIVTNGRPGHIQFYSPRHSTLVYNLDIVGQNYLPPENGEEMDNARVIAAEFSSDGAWLATSQARDNDHFSADCLLKFWMFNRSSQAYELKTNVSSHHRIHKILFGKTNAEDIGSYYAAVTMSSDKKFRFWVERPLFDTPDKSFPAWDCISVGYYKDFELFDVCFSEDGSLLAAAFGPCLTIWDSESKEMKCSLTKGTENLKAAVFSHKCNSFMAISASQSNVYAWNLLSFTLAWSVESRVSLLIADPLSEYVAAFTKNNSLYIYESSSSNCVFHCKKLLKREKGKVLSALFYPNERRLVNPEHPWMNNSTLYYYTSKQELMALESETEETRGKKADSVNYAERAPKTPFQRMLAGKKVSAARKAQPKTHMRLGIPWTETVTEFIELPAHAMPPVSSLCESLLQSLVVRQE